MNPNNNNDESDYSDESDEELVEQNEIPNQNLIVQQIQEPNIVNKRKDFGGNIQPKNNWSQCVLCDRYYPQTLFLPNMSYCAHCWGWTMSNFMDLTNCVYSGQNTIDEVKHFLSQTLTAHDSNLCKNVDCIYNKILLYKNSDILHLDLGIAFGFVEPPKEKIIKKKTNIKSDENILKKKHTKFNYSSSTISI